jgi:chlorobactene glucosyltransferase
MALELVSLIGIVFISGALCVIACIAILNAFAFPRLGAYAGRQADSPRVSVLIPARNEAAVIGDTVRPLLSQGDALHELLLLDDHSTDGTADAARQAAADDPRLKIIAGAPLPDGWFGKNWACHQLAEQASGDLLVFTDADVDWRPGALDALGAARASSGADMLTVWPTQVTRTWSERVVVPLMAFVIHGYLPAPLVNGTRYASFSAANGQCIAFTRDAYQRVGGHAAVRDDIVEDIRLARLTKRAGRRLVMIEGDGLVACRMYADWRQVRDGYAKNIVAGYGSVPAMLAGTVFHWLVLLGPWLWLLLGAGDTTGLWPGLPLAWIALGIGTRALTAAATRQRIGDAVTLPIGALLMTIIAGQALYWQVRYGGVRWKGRTLKRGKAGSRRA